VLSVMPGDYATNVTKIRLAANLSEEQTQNIIQRLLALDLIEVCDGMDGDPVYRITTAGSKHPQYGQHSCRAQPPRLPVESDRVLTVLSALLDNGPMRIHEARDALGIPHDSIRALMQYLKRKALVRKTEQALLAPYELTDKGHGALTEMLRRRAA
jgi:predicted transcriptional regulator